MEKGVSENNSKGIKRISNAFIFSLEGFKACFKTEEAFRQEIYLAAFMIPMAFWIGNGAIEHCLLVGSVFLVLIVEILNSAIERAIDRISFEKHDLSKEAKDMGSAAVFLMLLLCGFVWVTIIGGKFL